MRDRDQPAQLTVPAVGGAGRSLARFFGSGPSGRRRSELQNVNALELQRLRFDVARRTFIGDTHWTCLDAIVRSLLQGSRLTTLTGAPGAGKTTILNAAIMRLMQQPFCFIQLSGDQVNELRTRHCESLQSVREWYRHLLRRGGGDVPGSETRVCLLVDNAERLPRESLQIFVHLAQLSREHESAPMMLLVGRSEFWTSLRHPSLLRVRQQVTTHLTLYPLSDEGTRRYVENLFEAAHASVESIIPPRAMNALVLLASGNPGRINALVVASLEFACRTGRAITERVVEEAASALDDSRRQPARRTGLRLSCGGTEIALRPASPVFRLGA